MTTEGRIADAGGETWYGIVAGGEEPERYREPVAGFLDRVERG